MLFTFVFIIRSKVGNQYPESILCVRHTIYYTIFQEKMTFFFQILELRPQMLRSTLFKSLDLQRFYRNIR